MMLLLLLGLPSVAHAFSTITINCTAPTQLTNFVAGGNTRSTLDILWSCLFTILTCTWTALHLTVPEQRWGRDPGIWGDVKWMTKGFLWKSGWMIAMILAPEFIITQCVERLLSAVVARNTMKQRAEVDGVQWSLTHAFFADMGGFAIKTRSRSRNGQAMFSAGSHALPVLDTNNSTAPGTSGDDSVATDPSSLSKKGDSRLVHVNNRDIRALLEKGILAKLPDNRVEEINDKSKNDVLVKSFAVVQIFSVVVQVITRHARGLAVSQLELVVAAFSFCAIIVYSTSFCMPKDVQSPIIIADLTSAFSFKEAFALVDSSTTRNFKARQAGFDPGILSYDRPGDLGGQFEWVINTCLCLTGALFGAIHCFAWNFSFPTPIEQTLWRVASTVSTGLLVVIYGLARLCIIVEVFRTFFFLPPSAFTSTWASNIPQVG